MFFLYFFQSAYDRFTSENQYLAGSRDFDHAKNILEKASSLYPANSNTVDEVIQFLLKFLID